MILIFNEKKPIIFSGEMIRAILDGRKTQTRRVVKGRQFQALCNGDRDTMTFQDQFGDNRNIAELCPYGQPGNRLWVRETFAIETNFNASIIDYHPPFNDGRPVKKVTDETFGDYWEQVHYRATDPTPALCCEEDDCRQCEINGEGPHWSPSIHMHRWASRITLDVTGVRIERLQDISDQDAQKEGCDCRDTGPLKFSGPIVVYMTSKAKFLTIWNSLYKKKDRWEDNPWVWVITFKRIEENKG